VFLSISNLQLHSVLFVKDNHPFLSTIADIIIIIIIIIYLLKQEDAHMINTRTTAGQERHRKLALTFCPLKKKKNTRYKNNYYYSYYNYDYAYRKNVDIRRRLM